METPSFTATYPGLAAWASAELVTAVKKPPPFLHHGHTKPDIDSAALTAFFQFLLPTYRCLLYRRVITAAARTAPAKPDVVSPKQNAAYSISASKWKVPKNIHQVRSVLRLSLMNFLLLFISEAIKHSS